MKIIIGSIMFIAGLILLMNALTMDVSVEVDYEYGNLNDLPERVNNIGLMADRQNYIIIGLVLTVLGGVIYGKSGKKIEEELEQKKCPKCAELIKKEALICRFCNHQFINEDEEKINEDDYEIDEEAEKIRKNLNNSFFKQ